MEFDLETKDLDKAYAILSALVSPRPIAWVSTLSKKGVSNLAPFSFFNVFGSKPPIVAFAPGNRPDGSPKDTAQNIMATKEFVINLVSSDTAQAMANSSLPHLPDTSEIEAYNLATQPSLKVSPPRIATSPASLECKLYEVKTIGQNRMIIGTVVSVFARDDLFDIETGQFHQESYQPIGRMASPHWYCQTSSPFEVKPDKA